MTLRLVLLATTLLAAPLAAAAQSVTGLYVGLGAGGTMREASESGGLRVATDGGPVGLLGLGWGFGNGLRAEVEGGYRSNAVATMQSRGAGPGTATGRIASTTLMANLLLDLDLTGAGLPVRPYLGGGIGHAWHRYDAVSGTAPAGPVRRILDDADGGLAYQAIGGVSLPLGGVPGLDVTAEYRYFAMAREASIAGGWGPDGSPAGQEAGRFASRNHSALLGLRYSFGAASAAAPPARPAAATTRLFLVFFDWDRAELTDRARQTVAEAAGLARRQQAVRIELAGHADRSGVPQYSQPLSERRAEAVAAELLRQGLRREEVAVTAMGESRPLAPAAEGGREPQGRRVEILLR